MSRFLVVNADDFGMSPRVNTAVARAHTQGILTSASLMVAEPGFEEAVEWARHHPSCGVGLHVVVSCDRALLSPKSIPHLVGPNGRFGADPLRVGIRYALSKAAQRELGLELEAQFARFASTKLPWSHVDGHQHMHLHPAILSCLLPLCYHYRIHRIRLPREEFWGHWRNGGARLDANVVAALFLRMLARRALRILHAFSADNKTEPFFFCDRVYGQLQSGNMHAAYLVKLLPRLKGRTNEVYFHPGTQYARKLPHYQQVEGVEDVELQALLQPKLPELLRALGIQRGTYAEAERFALKQAMQQNLTESLNIPKPPSSNQTETHNG